MILLAFRLVRTACAYIRRFGQQRALGRDELGTVLGAVIADALLAEFTAEMTFTVILNVMLPAYIVSDAVPLAIVVIKELTICLDLS